MNKEERIQHLKRILLLGIILGLCIGIIIGFIFGIWGKNKNVCYDVKSLNETLETISGNCHSTFITKQWNDDAWYVFNTKDCQGEYCKSTYIKLEDCLN